MQHGYKHRVNKFGFLYNERMFLIFKGYFSGPRIRNPLYWLVCMVVNIWNYWVLGLVRGSYSNGAIIFLSSKMDSLIIIIPTRMIQCRNFFFNCNSLREPKYILINLKFMNQVILYFLNIKYYLLYGCVQCYECLFWYVRCNKKLKK